MVADNSLCSVHYKLVVSYHIVRKYLLEVFHKLCLRWVITSLQRRENGCWCCHISVICNVTEFCLDLVWVKQGWGTRAHYNIMIIIAFKGAIQDFLQSPHCAVNCLQHVPGAILCKSRPNTLCAYHMQHVVLRATCCEGKAQLFSLTELKSHLFELYFYWLNH